MRAGDASISFDKGELRLNPANFEAQTITALDSSQLFKNTFTCDEPGK